MSASPSAGLLELRQVTRQFPGPDGGSPLTVLRDLNLTLPRGQRLAIMGPSGCGKSTLLNLMGALDRPTVGSVLLDGTDLATCSDAQLAQIRNRRLGFMFQLHHLLPQCTVLENVLVPTLVGSPDRHAPQRAGELLARVGLADHQHHRPAQLSGGQRQRAALVRALINQPDLLLADEPTGALDRRAGDDLADLLVELNESMNLTLVIVTHAPALAQRQQRTLYLYDGQLHQQPLTVAEHVG